MSKYELIEAEKANYPITQMIDFSASPGPPTTSGPDASLPAERQDDTPR